MGGPDGHTASLFPGHKVLDAKGSVALVTDSPKPPKRRVTLTLASINRARKRVFVVTGDSKAVVVAEIKTGRYLRNHIPLALSQCSTPSGFWMRLQRNFF